MFKRPLPILAAIAFLIAATRFVYVASESETGWGMVLTQWQDATLGLVGLGHTPIGRRPPSRQADFWLDEVDRVMGDHRDSASMYMGAAWVLDSPGIGFVRDHLKQIDVARAAPQLSLDLDRDAIEIETAAFRKKSIGRCLELAVQATKLDPTDVRWWRLRALLLFEGDSFHSGREFLPREENWLLVLDECRTHDPGNALYDYLAALQFWNTSASYDWPIEAGEIPINDENDAVRNPLADEADLWTLTVRDSERFALGTRCFDRAQELPLLAIGEAGYPAIAQFLASSRLRKADQADIAISRLVTFRHSTLFLRLWRWQDARADAARQDDDLQQTVRILRQSLRLCDQAAAPRETSALNTLAAFDTIRQSIYQKLVELTADHPDQIERSELVSIRRREEALRVESLTLQSALRKLSDESYPKEFAASWPAVFTTVTSASAAILFMLAGAFASAGLLLSHRLHAGERFSLLRLSIAWIVGCGVTFVFLGLAPAEVISHEVQRRVAVIGAWLAAGTVVAVAVLFVTRLLRRRKIRFRTTTLLIAMTVVAGAASLWPFVVASLGSIARNPPELWLHAKGWDGIDAEVLRTAGKLDSGSLYWAAIQWFAHGGVYFGLFVSLLLATFWFMWRCARRASRGCLSYWSEDIRPRWSALSAFVGRSCFTVGMCFVFLYLCAAPDAIRLSEAKFQHQMRYCRNPEAHWAEIRDAQAVVMDTPEAIEAIRDEVHFGMSGEGVLERDFSSQ